MQVSNHNYFDSTQPVSWIAAIVLPILDIIKAGLLVFAVHLHQGVHIRYTYRTVPPVLSSQQWWMIHMSSSIILFRPTKYIILFRSYSPNKIYCHLLFATIMHFASIYICINYSIRAISSCMTSCFRLVNSVWIAFFCSYNVSNMNSRIFV